MRQISTADIGVSLGNGALHRHNITLILRAARNLFFARTLEKEFDGLFEHGPGVFDGVALARDVKLRTKRYVAVAFLFDQSREVHRTHGEFLSREHLAGHMWIIPG